MPNVTPDTDSTPIHATEPILERTSDLYGLVCVYPPTSDPHMWASLSWLLTTSTDPDDGRGLNVLLKSKYVTECFERPHFINTYHQFGQPDPKYVPKKVEQRKETDIPDRTIKHKDFTFED